ncbi:MAG TPA: Calx-beta domain-containing protein [Planctomycetota bacterium]|nr:Calx-beta domain-containing protein [Planctomycetota bacterium]
MRLNRKCAALFLPSLLLSFGVRAAELQLSACDSTSGWALAGGATLTLTTRPNAGNALSVSFPANTSSGPGNATSPGSITFDAPNQDPFYPNGSTANYGGLRFWVKGDGSTNWGNVGFRYGANWTRAWALFPVTTTWTEVTIPWREFYTQNFDGPMDNNYKTVFRITFGCAFSQRDGHPLRGVPAHGFQIDDIRFVDGVTLPQTPKPSGTGVENTIAKLKAKQPVRIVVLGASISWGLQAANPASDNWPAKLQALLRAHYGYDSISIVNGAIPGFNSFEGACAAGWAVFDREPVDLVMVGDWCYNDYVDAEVLPNGAAEVARNYENFFSYVRRRGTSELMHIQSGLHCEAGNFDRMDPVNAALSNLCDTMNVYKADVYGTLKALGQPWLTANYYTIAGDYAHYNASGHARAAQIVFDAIVAAENSNPPPPVTPEVRFKNTASSESEASSPASLVVELSAATTQSVSVNYAVSGGTAGGADYTLASGTLTFAAGETQKTISLAIVNDTDVESDETVILSLSAPVNATLGVATHTYTIVNDDTAPSGGGGGGGGGTTPGAPPQIQSPPTASTNPIVAGEFVRFTINVTASSAVTVLWDFGDGTSSNASASVTKIYVSPGTFTLRVTVTDAAGQTASSVLSVTVVASGGGGTTPTANDTDGDGLSDADELAAGTNPQDANSKPGGTADADGDGIPDDQDADADGDGVDTAVEVASGSDPFNAASVAAIPFTVSKIQMKFKFGVDGKDSIQLSGILPGLPSGLQVAGQALALNIGGASAIFTLDARGKSNSGGASIALKLKGKRSKETRAFVFAGGDVAFKATLKKGTFSDDFSDEGVNPAASALKSALELVAEVRFAGRLFAVPVTGAYTAKANTGAILKK